MDRTDASHVDSVRLGSLEISLVCQGFAPLDLSDECPGQDVDWDAERRRHPWAFHPPGHAPGSWPWHVHAFAIRGPDGIVMVDTGLGSFPPFRPWAKSRSPEQAYVDAGVEPADVRVVVLTHLHADHAGGGLGPDGEPRFPNARYVVHPADWAFFADSDDAQDYTARHALARVDDLGMLDLTEDDRDVAPGVAVVHTPGHTPGHRSVTLTQAPRTLLLTGDLLHLPIQAAHPEWPSSHDEDPAAGAVSRARLLQDARQGSWTIGVHHFAEPFGTLTSGVFETVRG